MTSAHIETAVRQLDSALLRSSTVPLISASFPDFGLDHAYQVNHRWSELRRYRGASIRGYKVGLTSEAAQRLYAIGEPMYGVIFDDGVVHADSRETAEVSLRQYRQPRIELELAFVLARDIVASDDLSIEHLWSAIAAVVPAVEIVGYRCEGAPDSAAKRNIVDIVADNGLFCAAVLGPEHPRSGDMAHIVSASAALDKNGVRMAEGPASSVMGNPVSSLVWLAGKLRERGEILRAGQVVLSGAMTSPLAVAHGDHVRCDFGNFGVLQVRFS